MSARQKKPIDRLMMAVDVYALARAEASWTQGYRSREPYGAEHDRLYAKEQAQWDICHRSEKIVRKLALKLLREAKASSSVTPKSRRRSSNG